MSKFFSRKFLLALGGAACSLFLGITGMIDWKTAITLIITAIGGYVGIEGIADIIGRLKK